MPNVLITGGTGFVGKWMGKTCPKDITVTFFTRSGYESNIMEHVTGITHIVHLAPVSPERVIRLAKEHNARLLYCSSGIVYYPENDTKYRQDKIDGERLCVNSDIDFVIARLFTFFGNMTQTDKAITKFFECARHGKPLQVWGDCTRSYMHGAEMGRRMWDLLLKGESGEIRDIGSTRPQTVLRLAQRISAFTGAPIEFIDKQVPVPYYVPKG